MQATYEKKQPRNGSNNTINETQDYNINNANYQDDADDGFMHE